MAGPMPGPGQMGQHGLQLGMSIPGQPSHGMDPLFHYQIASGMYGPIARERLELEEREKRERMELEKRERELKDFEMKTRMASLGVTPGPGGPTFDPHLFELQRRYMAGMPPGAQCAPGQQGPPGGPGPGQPGGLPAHFGLYPPGERERLERLGLAAGGSADALHGLAAERIQQAERLAALSSDPVVRMQMAHLAQELHSQAHTHAHTHAHAHTHLHLHPQDPISAAAAAAAAAMGMSPQHPSSGGEGNNLHPSHPLYQPGARPPQGMLQRPDMLHPSAGLGLRPPYDDQLAAHQVSSAFSKNNKDRCLKVFTAALSHASHASTRPSTSVLIRPRKDRCCLGRHATSWRHVGTAARRGVHEVNIVVFRTLR